MTYQTFLEKVVEQVRQRVNGLVSLQTLSYTSDIVAEFCSGQIKIGIVCDTRSEAWKQYTKLKYYSEEFLVDMAADWVVSCLKDKVLSILFNKINKR